jgi:hypothetical protein
MPLFRTFLSDFFDHMHTYALKIPEKTGQKQPIFPSKASYIPPVMQESVLASSVALAFEIAKI